MLVCRDRNTLQPRQRRLSVFWSRGKTQYRGEVWRGALQVFWTPPRLEIHECVPTSPSPARWVASIPATAWTGRTRAWIWRWTPGRLEVYLRTPSHRSWAFVPRPATAMPRGAH